VEIALKLKVPSPVTNDVTSISYQVEAATLPNVAKLAVSAPGALFQLTVPSFQVVSATRWNSPPNGEGSTQYSRNLALSTERPPTPETVNLRSMFLTGLLSATNWVDEPKLLVGRSDST
jgi:hypothetical protein